MALRRVAAEEPVTSTEGERPTARGTLGGGTQPMTTAWIDGVARALGEARTRRQALRVLAGAAGMAGVAAATGRVAAAGNCQGNGQGCNGNIPCCSGFKCQTNGNPNAGTCVKVQPPPSGGGGSGSGGGNGKKQITITLDCTSKPQSITISNGGTKGLTLLSIGTEKGKQTYTVKDADKRLAPNASITFEAGLTAQRHPISRQNIFAKKNDGVVVDTKEFGKITKSCKGK